MQKIRTEIPNKPRFDFATDKANGLLIELEVDSFPIDPFHIVEELNYMISCFSWTEARKILDVEDPLLIKKTECDAKVVKRGNNYLIVYDDLINTPARIRWSIMHEIGHVILGHLDDFLETEMSRRGLSEEKYSVLEREADAFAVEMMSPSAIVKYSINLHDEDSLRCLTSLSREASHNRFSNLNRQCRKPKREVGRILYRNFSKFIDYKLYETIHTGRVRAWDEFPHDMIGPIVWKCSKCYSFTPEFNDKTNFCIYCGERLDSTVVRLKNTDFIWEYESSEVKKATPTFHRKFYTVDRRLQFCPVCLNHDIKDEDLYCSICGQELENRCLTDNIPVPSMAHYCHECGQPTAFRDAYITFEKRQNILDVKSYSFINDNLTEYRFWGAISKFALDWDLNIRTLLLYTKAYTDDEENLYVFVLNKKLQEQIKKYKDEILDIVNDIDDIVYKTVEVINIDDL